MVDCELPLALSMGEAASVSGEITLRVYANRTKYSIPPFIYIGKINLLKSCAKFHGLDIKIEKVDDPFDIYDNFEKFLPVYDLDIPSASNYQPAKHDIRNNLATIEAIRLACQWSIQGKVGGMCTNPINKSLLRKSGFEYNGHTEYISDLCGCDKPVMMLLNDEIRVVALTIHMPLKKVFKNITINEIVKSVLIIDRDMKNLFGVSTPTIALCGLNPHAGEDGVLGDEEIRIITPAIKKLQDELNISVYGPFSADSLFAKPLRDKYDVIVGMYHDQALIPVKTIDFNNAVNVTLGLPIIRTSPAHGTGFEIAGRNVANWKSLAKALMLAKQLAELRNLKG